jgi:hypothetical protein
VLCALWHATHKTARVFVFDKGQAHAGMAAAGGRAGKVLRDLVETHIAMIDLEKQLHRALQPYVDSPYRSGPSHTWIKIKTSEWREANRERWKLFETA